MRIAVAGGTGTVGRYVVEAARHEGHDVRVLSRRTGVDLFSGAGLAGALRGAEVVVDTTSSASLTASAATNFFVTVTRRLQAAAAAEGVARLVVLSIVGIDRVPGFGYYAAKRAQEAAARSGLPPALVVRATQFHEFPAQILARGGLGPVAAVPRMTVQPVAARSVGELLVALSAAPPDEPLVEVAGPERADLVELARAVLVRLGRRAAVAPLHVPGEAGRAMRGGALLPGGDARIVAPRFSDWLRGDDVTVVSAPGRRRR